MKKIYSSIVLLVITLSAWAQTPQYYNSNVPTGGANVYPFGNSTVRKVQWRISANSLGTVGPGNNITAVYFLTQNNLSNTYPIINIKMKQNGGGLSGGGLFDTGMQTVYTGINVTKTAVPNGWMQFILQTPFTYDPSQPLLLEVEQNSTNSSGPYIWQTAGWGGAGFGRQWGDYGQSSYIGGDGNVVHFGI